jgi:hypothetical protein
MKPQRIALTNTTLSVLMAGINSGIVLIALPPTPGNYRGVGGRTAAHRHAAE